MHAMGEISETAFKPLRFGVWNIKHNAPCKSIACLEWRIWERARERKARESENKSGREGVSEWVTCIWVFPTAAVCVFVCAWAGFLAVVPFCLWVQESSFNPLLSQSPPTPPHHTWFSLTKGPNGSIFYCGFWEQAERERDSWSPSVASAPPSTHVTFTQESFNSWTQLGKSSWSLWQIAVKCDDWIGLVRSCTCVICAYLSEYTSGWQGCHRWGRPSLANWSIVNIHVKNKQTRTLCVRILEWIGLLSDCW